MEINETEDVTVNYCDLTLPPGESTRTSAAISIMYEETMNETHEDTMAFDVTGPNRSLIEEDG